MKELNTFRKFLNEGGSIKAEEATVAVNLNQPMAVTFSVDDFGSDEEFHKFVFDLHNDESVAYGAFFQNFDLNSFLDHKADQEKFTVSVTDDSGIMNEGEEVKEVVSMEMVDSAAAAMTFLSGFLGVPAAALATMAAPKAIERANKIIKGLKATKSVAEGE